MFPIHLFKISEGTISVPLLIYLNQYPKIMSSYTKYFLISSFKWDELRAMRALNAEIPIAILTEDDPAKAIEIATALKAEAINPNFKMLNRENNLQIQVFIFQRNVYRSLGT